MSKLIKKELNLLKSTLLKYKPKVPLNHLDKYNKDIKYIFDEIDSTVDYDSLQGLKKVAKSKIIALERQYGTLDEDINPIKESLDKESGSESSRARIEEELRNIHQRDYNFKNEKIGDLSKNFNKPILTVEEENDIKDILERFDESMEKEWKPMYDELLKSDAFNKEIVNTFHEKLDECFAEIVEKQKGQALKEEKENKPKLNDLPDNHKVLASGKMDTEKYYQDGKLDRKGVENYILDVLKKFDAAEVDEETKEISINAAIDDLERVINEECKLITNK